MITVFNSDHSFSGWSQLCDESFQFWSQLFRLITALGWEYAILITACLVLSCIAFGCLMRPLESSQASASKVKNPVVLLKMSCWLSFFLAEGRTTRRRKAAYTEQWIYNRRAYDRKRKTSKWTYHPFTSGKPDFHIFFCHSFESSFSWHWKKRLVEVWSMPKHLGHGTYMNGGVVNVCISGK